MPAAAPRPTVSGPVAFGVVAATSFGLWAVFTGIDWVAPGELIWPVPADVYALVVFVGVLLLILAAARVIAVAPARRAAGRSADGRVGTLIAAPILLFMLLAGFARVAVQVAGFAGLHPIAVAVPFAVVGVDERHARGGAVHYVLRLRYGAAGRVFDDPVARSVHDAARDGDTVTRPVETGRFGLQRAMVAAPLSVGDLHHQG